MKQRLVGAIVLVALAVIFLPMLLDGSGQSGPRDVAIDIPDQPQPPPNRLTQSDDSTPDNPDAAASASPSGVDSRPDNVTEQAASTDAESTAGQTASTDDDPTQAADASTSGAASSGDAPAAEQPAPDTATPDDSSGATDSASSSEQTTDASTASAGDESKGSWVVQVGSFGRETNALVLRDRLRELGFDTFVEPAETEDGPVWRVRVGPVSSEDEAQRLSERVTEQRGGPALVMTQP